MKKIKEYLNQIFYTRKVKVMKCDNPFSWYYTRIGEKFIVEKYKKEYDDGCKPDYITIDEIHGNKRGYIKKSDVKIYYNL